jgi:hypothetical protein
MVERVTAIKKSASTVTVACKLPNGLILQLWEMGDEFESSPTGTRTIKKAHKKGEPIKLNGCALKFGQVPEVPMPGGYALTQVPADFWEEWVAQDPNRDVLVNRVIFAHSTMDATSQQAREQHVEKVKSGLEPIDPKNPPKVGMKITPYSQTAN